MRACSRLDRLAAFTVALFALLLLCLTKPASANDTDDLDNLARTCAPNVDPQILLNLIGSESGGHPLAIGRRVKSPDGTYYLLDRQPSSKAEAISWATYYLQHGWIFDGGLLQVRSTNFPRYALTAENVFDPCQNVRAGSTILSDFYQAAVRQYGKNRTALEAALVAYKTGTIGKIASP